MISFFKKSTSYKFIFLFFLFLAIRLPLMIYGKPLLIPEINWMLVAEKMNKGYFLYSEIWDDISPLSALVYQMIYALSGKSPLGLQILASLLIFIQAIFLNQILQKRQVYLEQTLVPALLYILLMSSFIDYFTLSPVLMANTFLLVVIRYLLLHISEKSRYNAVFEIGAYTALATLFYLPSFLILAVPLLAFVIYTGTKFRDYLLMFFAFSFTIGIAFLFFYILDSEYEFYISFFQSIFNFSPQYYLELKDLAVLFALPLVLVIGMILSSSQYRRYTNYQNKCMNLLIIWFFCSIFSVFFSSKISAYSLMIVMPAVAFLLSHYFLMMRNPFLKELVFLLLALSIFSFNYLAYNQIRLKFRQFEYSIFTENLFAEPHPQARLMKGKKVLVLGNQIHPYRNASLATPYLNWQLAQRHFGQMDKYNIIVQIYQNFSKEPPDVVIDENDHAKRIFTFIPLVAENYEKLPKSNVYVRRKNKISSSDENR